MQREKQDSGRPPDGDHVHMLICVPPKYSVSQVVGFIKAKSAINIAGTFLGQKKNFTGHNFWARGYFVSTLGKDEKTIREYIKKLQAEDRRLDQLHMFEKQVLPPVGGPWFTTALSGPHFQASGFAGGIRLW
jgi:hypothetical protein